MHVTDRISVANRVKTLRLDAMEGGKLSQAKFAKLAGVTRQEIQRIEAGIHWPRIPTLMRLAQVAGLEFHIGFKDPKEITKQATGENAGKMQGGQNAPRERTVVRDAFSQADPEETMARREAYERRFTPPEMAEPERPERERQNDPIIQIPDKVMTLDEIMQTMPVKKGFK